MKTTLIILSIFTSFAFSCSAPPQQAPQAVTKLTPTEFKAQKLGSKTVLLDVRTPQEFADGHLDGAENVDYRGGEFAEEMKNWDKKKVYYLYCASGNRSSMAAQLLHDAGFEHVYNIGGFNTLKEAGIPTTEESLK